MNDPVNHPSHYTRFKGIEVIQLTEQLNFCRGNAVKYIARAGAKDPASEIQDLEKAIWYIQREIDRLDDENWSRENDYISFQPGEQIDWQEVFKKRAKTNEDYYDYYRAGMTKTFDEVAFPQKCQECNGDCVVCD